MKYLTLLALFAATTNAGLLQASAEEGNPEEISYTIQYSEYVLGRSSFNKNNNIGNLKASLRYSPETKVFCADGTELSDDTPIYPRIENCEPLRMIGETRDSVWNKLNKLQDARERAIASKEIRKAEIQRSQINQDVKNDELNRIDNEAGILPRLDMQIAALQAQLAQMPD